MGRDATKYVVGIALTIIISTLIIVYFSWVIITDKRVPIHYNITFNDSNIKYYSIHDSMYHKKLIVVFKDGTVVEKRLPLDVGYHENLYWAYYLVIALTIIFGSLLIIYFIDEIRT